MNIHTSLLDYLFPPRDSARLLRTIRPTSWAAQLQGGTVLQCVYLASYRDKIVQAAITEQKFYANPQAQTLLAALVRAWITRQQSDKYYVLPIPLSAARYRARGYNQVERVLSAALPRTQVLGTILTRTIDTPPQTSLPKSQRVKNLNGAFTCTPARLRELPHDAHLVLVDDVITTGATMTTARAALAPHLSSTQTLSCLAFAH